MDTLGFTILFSTHLDMGKFSLIESLKKKNRWKGKRSDYKSTEYKGKWREGKKDHRWRWSNLKEIILAQRRPLLKKRHQEKKDSGHSRVQGVK